MRVSYKWLQEFVDIDISPQELADRLTLAGITVEGVIELGKGIEKVVTGRIESLATHPNADKLMVSSVNVGTENLQIITAATNVREGDVIPVAIEGARLASGLVIKKAKLRGVESRGMMCSGQELGIDPKTMASEQAHGIMILPPGTALGKDAKEILGLDDFILELDLTPNRGDCLSIIGVAREAAALLGRSLKQVQPRFSELPERIDGLFRVDISDVDLCRRFSGRLIKNVHVGRSPLWMQQRLRSAGIRPINNIVDVTNYVMLELGQPMHAFDYNLLKDGHIIVRRSRKGEKIVSLDGSERSLTPDMLVIADPSGPVGIAGVMGGLATEVTEKSVSILLESAFFNPISIRRTSKSLGLRSEASLRFEKGIDIGGCARAADRAAQLIADMGAGDVVSGIVDNVPLPIQERTVTFRPTRATYVLGVEISGDEALRILKSLNFSVQDSGENMLVTVPTYRVDVNLEVDLIEEIARMYGYNRVPDTLPFGQSTRGLKTRQQSFIEKIRCVLAEAGLYEVVTYSFISPRVFDNLNLPAKSTLRNTIKVTNPLSEEQSVMRTILLPGLIEVLSRNYSRQVRDGAIFEIGRIFYPQAEGHIPDERPVLSGAVMGSSSASWNRKPFEMDFYYLKGVLEKLFRNLGTGEIEFRSDTAHTSFHPGRTASLEAGGERLGILGELHPDVAENFGLPEKVTAFEIDLNILMAASGRPVSYINLPRFPGVERDMAIIVQQGIPSSEIFNVIRLAGGELLRSIQLFDIYRGAQVPEGFQSMAFSMKFQAEDRTLTDAEVSERTEAISRDLAHKFNVELRVK